MMNRTKIETWITDLEHELKKIQPIEKEEQEKCMHLCATLFASLKEEIKSTGFNNQEEEIYFFRHLKPRVMSRFIYHSKLITIERRKPVGSTELKLQYYKDEQKKLDNFFLNHQEFNSYINSNQSFQDHFYFTKKEGFYFHIGEYQYIDFDPEFSTRHDFILSRLIACKNLHEFLANRIQELKSIAVTTDQDLQPLTWKASKTDMVELIYALHGSGSISDDIASIAKVFQAIFNINLGEFYKTWSSIRIRKKEKTPFINKLKLQLVQSMDRYND